MEVCFDLARSIDLHLECSRDTGEQVTAGRASGLIELHERVTWRAKHVFWQELTAEITEFDRPKHFKDVMVAGFFNSYSHSHEFIACQGFTLMIDTVEFRSPLWLVGTLLDILFVESHLTRYLQYRNAYLKMIAENSPMAAKFLH